MFSPHLRVPILGPLSLAALMASPVVLPASAANANTVHSCKNVEVPTGKKENEKKTVTRCIVEISAGKVGDVVEIKNQYNYIVASGRLLKREGRYGTVVITGGPKDVKTGDAVFLKNSDSNDYWTATTSPI